MRILFIAPRLPLPADTGGKIRTFNLIKQAAKTNKLDLVCFSFEPDDRRHAQLFNGLDINVKLVGFREKNILQKGIKILANSFPYSVTRYYSEDMEQAINLLLKENNYDVVHFDHIHMAHYFKCLNGEACLIDEHNVEYKILERCAGVENSLIKRKIFYSQSERMKNFEKQQIEKFSCCSAVSEDDVNVLTGLIRDETPVYVLPNGVDTGFFRQQGVRGQELLGQDDSLVFTGSMDWFPNDDAAVYLCKDILPFIWEIKPAVKFYIAGNNPSSRLISYAKKDERIVVAGKVNDVRPFMERAKVFVVPLRIGGGTRLKILEAMSMQKAIVSTSIGAEGIDFTKKINIEIADKPREFADKIIELLNNSKKRIDLGAAGRELVLQKYDWNIVGEKLRDVYQKLKIPRTRMK